MQKAIIFGANGYLGRHLAKALKANNIAFIPTGRATKSIDNYSNYVQVDICKPETLAQLDFDVDYIFVFAAITGTSTKITDYIVMKSVNELGLLTILQQHQQSNNDDEHNKHLSSISCCDVIPWRIFLGGPC